MVQLKEESKMWNNEMILAYKDLVEKYKELILPDGSIPEGLIIVKLTADPRFTAEIADDPHAFLEGFYSFK
jgi:hypothetical protein